MTKIQISEKYGANVQMYNKKNGDISYYACYLNPNNLDKNGRPIRERVLVGNKSEGITQAQVKSISIELRLKAERGEKTSYTKNEKITLLELSEFYFISKRKEKLNPFSNNEEQSKNAEKNIKNDESRYRNHLSIFSNRNPEELDEDEIYEHTCRLKNLGLADSTVNSILILLNAILNLGIKKKLITVKSDITKIKGVDNARERYLTIEEIQKLQEQLIDSPILDIFVKLSLSTGGRLDTIRHIKVKDINFDTNIIILNDYKNIAAGGNKPRYNGYFTNNLKLQLLNFIRNKKHDDYIFSLPYNSKPLSKEYFQKKLKIIFDNLFNKDIKDPKYIIVIHSLRHTFASHLAIKGTTLYKIQKLLNHSTPKMTQRYAHLDPKFGSSEINKLSFL
ncbi:MAG: site-specific integrase [Burkholderiales bacterium]|nr:site-specific integrase [Burkholderiales bacterium]